MLNYHYIYKQIQNKTWRN